MVDAAEMQCLPFWDSDGREVARIAIYPETAGSLRLLSKEEAERFGEECVQLCEERCYEYRVLDGPPGTRLASLLSDRIITNSRIPGERDRGRIEPGSATGLLPLALLDAAGTRVASSAVEVCCRKLDYRTEYRTMVEAITERCLDLLLNIRAASQVRLTSNVGDDARTVAQRFCFLRSLLDTEDFRNALAQITKMPHHRLEMSEAERSLRQGSRLRAADVRQLAAGTQRTSIPADHPLCGEMIRLGVAAPSLPVRATRSVVRETIDTPENQFVKHAMETFAGFLAEMERRLSPEQATDARLLSEVRRVREHIVVSVSSGFLAEVSRPHRLSLGSPVLQSRPGYREVLAAWLKFSLAAKLIWAGGDDVFGGGKRDLSALYEYWLFFVLLELVVGKFGFAGIPAKELIEETKDGFALKLKQGHATVIDGTCIHGHRSLRVRLAYNRRFSQENCHPKEGSWTVAMRPDFTLSFWPADFEDEEAEAQDLMVHIHLDAKYKAESAYGMFGAQNDNADLLNAERANERQGVYKRADLLKMHAYRDAIRRTEGAYVLYPGSLPARFPVGYHEILPGLGAFAVRPGPGGTATGLERLSEFIDEVISHLCDRASQREAITYHRQRVLSQPATSALYAPCPERGPDGCHRAAPPRESFVAVTRYSSVDALRWISERLKCPLLVSCGQDASSLDPLLASVRHILVLGVNGLDRPTMLTVPASSPMLVRGSQLSEESFPGAMPQDWYIVFEVLAEHEFGDIDWSGPQTQLLVADEPRPRVMSLAEVLQGLTADSP